jgi:hypothetical protein
MQDKESKAILAKGLLGGYVGKTVRGSTNRAGFELKTSDYKGPEGTYHDEWDADFNGGGQELTIAPNGEVATRVYAGGTLAKEELEKIGLTKKEVIGKLVLFVNQAGDKTRLDSDIELSEGEDWKYTYKVLRKVEEIPLDLGQEEIRYKDSLVFIHFHIISPVI